MKTKYIDLIEQTFDWPQEEFKMDGDQLMFHDIPLMDLIRRYGTPLKFTYLPKISRNIQRAKAWFATAKAEIGYDGEYHYCYCTKSSHFRHVLETALQNDIHLETSSAYDIDLIKRLATLKKVNKSQRIVCNGFKKEEYVNKILDLKENGFEEIIPVIDNEFELNLFKEKATSPLNIGIRIASEEEPKFEFYTSRLGIGYRSIARFYKKQIHEDPNMKLKMLHFFINSGIKDTAYYWNELVKCLKVYCELRELCPTLDSLNIGGGFPIKNSLVFSYDYQYMVTEILRQIKSACDDAGVPVPHIYTEFGSFTVGESGGAIFKILYQKEQNDREKWNMIDSSFMTTLPDTWAINKRFIMLPVNNWKENYERVFLGGLTCDSDDYYNSEQHTNAIYLPKYYPDQDQYIGFFNTGAYQETLGGFGGIHHCLIPSPRHILIDKDDKGKLRYKEFAAEQKPKDVLEILGYYDK
ncbi:MAG: arginine decarboxylase [Flavobacteriales bacterium]